MAAGTGGDRPYTPKKPDPEELNTESLFNEFKNLQRRNKWLKEVRLELSPEMPEYGEGGHFVPDYYMDQDPESGEFSMVRKPATIRLFLPALRKNFEFVKGYPKVAGDFPKRPTADFTKYVKATLRHEAIHAQQMQQTRIRGTEEELQTRPTKGRAAYLDTPAHGKLFNVLNRMLAGSGSEAILEKIGLPPSIYGAYQSRQGQLAPRG